MKNLILILAAAVAIPLSAPAQDCSKYYPMHEGSAFQYTSYDRKGKSQGTLNYTINDVDNSGAGTSAMMNLKYIDDKGEEVFTTDYSLTCENDVVHIDYESLINKEMMQQYEGMEMEITGTDLELPNNLSVGQELADANVHVKLNMSGINMNMNVETINRKVEKKESVTTPAGTFECFVIYSENKSKMMLVNSTFPSRLWLAEGVGMIKQESYNKGGKLVGYMELTALTR